jgi:hypothetical protein
MSRGLLFLFFLISTSANAAFELAGTKFNMYPEVETSSGDKLSYTEWTSFFRLPDINKEDRTIFIHELNYALLSADLENLNGSKEHGYFHSFFYSAQYIKNINSDWNAVVSLSPGIASDLKGSITKDDLILNGMLLAKYKINPAFSTGFGFGYFTIFGSPLLAPVLQAEYTEGPWKVAMVLPVSLDIGYTLSKANLVGFRAESGGNDFKLHSFETKANVDADQFHYSRINIGPYGKMRVGSNLLLELFGGVTSRRIAKFDLENGQSYSYEAKNGAFASLSLSYTP